MDTNNKYADLKHVNYFLLANLAEESSIRNWL